MPGGQAAFGAAGGKQRAFPSPSRLQIVPCGHLQFGGVPTIPPEHAAAMAATTHVPLRNTLPCGQSQPPPAFGTMPGLHCAWLDRHAPLTNCVPLGQQLGGEPTGRSGGHETSVARCTHRPERKMVPSGQPQPPSALRTMPSRHGVKPGGGLRGGSSPNVPSGNLRSGPCPGGSTTSGGGRIPGNSAPALDGGPRSGCNPADGGGSMGGNSEVAARGGPLMSEYGAGGVYPTRVCTQFRPAIFSAQILAWIQPSTCSGGISIVCSCLPLPSGHL